jgi:hypothetical protein
LLYAGFVAIHRGGIGYAPPQGYALFAGGGFKFGW